jgi:nucleoside-diphosphate-sugar epimerase
MDNKIIRPFNFYGCGMLKNDGRIIPKFFQTALDNNKILVFSDGKQTRTYCNIIDAIPNIIYVSLFGKSFVYNIGNDSPEISAYKLAIKIKKTINNSKIKILKIDYPSNYPSDEPRRRCPNIKKIKKEFGYKRKISLEAGLKLFYNNQIR